MYYEINVTLNGRHFFTTAPIICDNVDLVPIWNAIRSRFCPSQGYKVTVTKIEETIGTIIDMAKGE